MKAILQQISFPLEIGQSLGGALLVFLAVFLGICCWVFRKPVEFYNKMCQLPFHQGGEGLG